MEQWVLDNLEQQKDELASILDIYSEEITVIREPSSYSFKVVNDDNESEHILLEIKCPKEYPSSLPPTYSISSSYLKHIPSRRALEERFKSIWSENEGQCIMFEAISEFQEFAATIFSDESTKNGNGNGHDDDLQNQMLIQQLILDDAANANRDEKQAMDSIHEINGGYAVTTSIEDQRNRLRQIPDILPCRRVIEDRKSVFKSWAAFVSDGLNLFHVCCKMVTCLACFTLLT